MPYVKSKPVSLKYGIPTSNEDYHKIRSKCYYQVTKELRKTQDLETRANEIKYLYKKFGVDTVKNYIVSYGRDEAILKLKIIKLEERYNNRILENLKNIEVF